jgi:hypothetical protein
MRLSLRGDSHGLAARGLPALIEHVLCRGTAGDLARVQPAQARAGHAAAPGSRSPADNAVGGGADHAQTLAGWPAPGA